MQLIINLPLSAEDREVLNLLLGNAPAAPAPAAKPRTAAKKAAAKPSEKPEVSQAQEESENSSEPPWEPETDGAGAAEYEDELGDAISLAMGLAKTTEGKAKIKAALAQVGHNKVSELPDVETVRAFKDALNG